jgi:hypothetical protein
MDWQERALKAEDRLRDIAQIPNDSPGWRAQRKQLAEDYFMSEQPNLFYLRDAIDKQFAAEFCWRGDDDTYHSMGISAGMLFNFLREAARIASDRGLLNLDLEGTAKTQSQDQHPQSSVQSPQDE